MLKAPHAQRDSRNVSKVRFGVFGCVRGYLHKVFLKTYTRHYTVFSMSCHEHYCKSVNITFIWYDTCNSTLSQKHNAKFVLYYTSNQFGPITSFCIFKSLLSCDQTVRLNKSRYMIMQKVFTVFQKRLKRHFFILWTLLNHHTGDKMQ